MTHAIATATQLAAILAMHLDDTTRAIARTGIALSHRQEQDLGAEHLDWLRDSLGLRVEMTDIGLVCSAAVAS